MFSFFSDMLRLARAGYALARRDALIPKEFEHHLPPLARWVAALTRIGAKTTRDGRQLRPGERLADAFQTLGPFYVKTGQFMATRPDIIGFEMANDLGRLQDRMPPFPQEEAIAELDKTFRKPHTALFQEFSQPIAAASIAQAHRGKLPDGRDVAVKILRPGVEREAAQDFRALLRVAHLVEWLVKPARRLEPVKFITTLRDAAILELDLRLEAGAASEMSDNLHADEMIRIPEVIWPLSARRILTVEWIDGTPLGDLAALDARDIDRKALAQRVLQSFLYQALHKGFFHADMHQGNMIVDREGRLALIDFGIMGRLDDLARRTFAEIIYGFINRDYTATAKAHFNAGYITREYRVEDFAQALRSVGEPLYGHDATQVDMSRVLQQLFDVTDMFNMHLRPELVMLQRTMVTVEGVARMLDPQINMWETATPIVRSYITERLGPKQQVRTLRDTLQKTVALTPHLPDYIETAAKAARTISDDRLGLSEQSTRDLAAALSREGRATRSALWFAGLAALLLAAVMVMRG